MGYISYINRLTANFALQFPNSDHHGNNGLSGANFNSCYSVWLQYSPGWCKILGCITSINSLIANFALKLSFFVAIATRISLWWSLMTTINLSKIENPIVTGRLLGISVIQEYVPYNAVSVPLLHNLLHYVQLGPQLLGIYYAEKVGQ